MIFVAICTSAGLLVAAELWFRRSRRRAGKTLDYPTVPDEPAYIRSHPYMSFGYAPGGTTPPLRKMDYPLHAGIYSPQLPINSFGFPGPEPSPVKKGLRIVCIGTSVTENIMQVGEGGAPFSYPLFIRRFLPSWALADEEVEVFTMAIGMWTSAEILINFILKVVDLRPDFITFYHGGNDVQAVLTPGFKSDYSHFRRNLGETLPLAKMYARLWRFFPDFPISILFGHLKSRFIMFLVGLLTGQAFPFSFPYRSLRENLGSLIRIGQLDTTLNFSRLDAEERNIECLIHLCRGFGIRLILSTYAYYAYDPSHALLRKYAEGVRLENEMIRRLAAEHQVTLVDNDLAVPKEPTYFLDACHLTEAGCRIVAGNFSDKIAEKLVKARNAPKIAAASRKPPAEVQAARGL